MAVQPESYNRTTRLRFPEDYHCTVRIAKAEKGPRGDILEYLQFMYYKKYFHML